MTLEEKLKHLQEASMRQARADGNRILSEYKQTLEEMYEEYQDTKKNQLKIFIDAEKTNVKQSVNKALAYEQLRLKKQVDQRQLELKELLLEDLRSLLIEYKASEAYKEYLASRIHKAEEFAKENPLKVYIDPSDEALQSELIEKTGVNVLISDRPFFGGMRAVIQSRNILIEESFETRLKEVFNGITFKGGEQYAN